MRTLRRDALEKLAVLSATASSTSKSATTAATAATAVAATTTTTTTTTTKQADIIRLCRRCPGPRSRSGEGDRPTGSRLPMSLPEMEALFALCRAARLVEDIEMAAQLLAQLTSYLPEAHIQGLSLPVAAFDSTASPWELLTFNLTEAILSLGLRHASLRQHASSTISRYVIAWANVAAASVKMQRDSGKDDMVSDESFIQAVTLAVSLLGFLDASSRHASFWTAHERLRLIRALGDMLSEKYMIALETALSVMRNAHTRDLYGRLKAWKHYSRRYASSGKPLGTMLVRLAFMRFVVACTALHVASPESLADSDVLEVLLSQDGPQLTHYDPSNDVPVVRLVEAAKDELKLLEEGSDYLQIGSAWQQRLASAVKANALKCLLCCAVIDDEVADPDALVLQLEATMADAVEIADDYLADVVFKCMAVLSMASPTVASNVSRSLPRIIVRGGLDSKSAAVAAQCLASVLRKLPQDATITTLYSLGNVLSAPGAHTDRNLNVSPYLDSGVRTHKSALYSEQNGGGSVISLGPTDAEEPSSVYLTTIEAIVCIAWSCKQDKIIALALSMLIQKIGRLSLEVDAKIITETAILAVQSAPSDLRSLLKLYSKLCHDGLVQENEVILDAVMRARLHLAHGIKRGSVLFEIYLLNLLDSIVSKGDAHVENNKHVADVELAAQEIAQLLRPLATSAAANASRDIQEDLGIEGFAHLQRDAWFNAVVHGFTLTSPYGQKYRREMQALAQYSMPLIAEDRADQLESDIELNTTLRRGKSADHAAAYKRHLIDALPACESDIKILSYAELVFLTASYMLESFRASAGDCTRLLTYFLDPQLKSGPLSNCIVEVGTAVVKTYLTKTLAGKNHAFSSPYVAQQLALFFAGCCHRISKVQEVAISSANLIISQVPSALCHRSSLFALFELLTIMWSSCLEQDTDEYEWRSTFVSQRGKVQLELSDDYSFRRRTLVEFHRWAKIWMLRVLDIAPLDIKGLIQTYLSECDDEGTHGHISLGRSFALELGGVIPSTDQRLGAIERQPGLDFNTASDFVAQYTTRQEYRYVDGIGEDDHEWLRFGNGEDSLIRKTSRLDESIEDARILLVDMEDRTLHNQHVSIAELRDVLRRAGALLCRTDRDQGAIVHHLVGIPFAVFSKQAMNLGISLWTGVIKENARMESRILVEIAENWENTVRQCRGLFDSRLNQPDPFYVKQEFAPSDRSYISRRQRFAQDLIGPHLRLVQFLSSHFNATRLGTPYIQRVYQRLINITLDALQSTKCHPLAREAHFHIILLGLRILRYSSNLDDSLQWRFKDRLLSAALIWFASRPKWSFGGNRLQIKAETHLLSDVQSACEKVSHIGQHAHETRKSLQPKQELLSLLLSNEQTVLMVWLYPLDLERKPHVIHGHQTKPPSDAALAQGLKTAWAENPALAVQIARRFQSASLTSALRFLLLNFPDRVLDEFDAVEMLLGSSIPSDVSFQLKYLLYWACVNPITAVTYFLPAFGNHPFVIQYAMRALESHSVDETFFYVPQIVQTLRYDSLGYVERYIIETARFSQLFAHQIIWNMKANAFKDEDSQIPDPAKPTLDKVMDSLVSSFSTEDRSFYQREFDFFNEVTGISGKLKPFIKKSKPEKKQKIEEELRKIKVEVGVYLPSNPDGVVIGIDRKSGKPLQSHAKAPYMATFRIRKQTGNKDEGEVALIKATTRGVAPPAKSTFEVWQSAIFKVGDDCRQDVLALQMIAAFRGIFHSVGLDVYVNPYRVTATAPGCGVIDVLPNSISRDMLGREAVNGLYDYFTSKYGGEDSIRFQEARNNFVKSMAAYSVISFLLQFKDRHNGNIMIDDAGHILHIDFGFCFDIVPGGVKFERAPFKLTAEMVAVMGGSQAQSYQWFEELCIKAFIVSRQHAEHLIHMVVVMLDSGLPCFKPQTIQHFRDRFVLDKSEREAADFMRDLIKKSYNSIATKGYDHFQLLTNGIPY